MIIIKNDKEIDLMRIAGRIVAETLLLVEKKVKPGITTAELDRIAEEFITKHGAIPSFKGLYGFPASLCISVNEQVVHGIPGGYVLKDGDSLRGFMPDWIGEFYAYYQWYYNLSSEEVLEKVPLEFIMKAYYGLHDLDLELAVKKVGESV